MRSDFRVPNVNRISNQCRKVDTRSTPTCDLHGEIVWIHKILKKMMQSDKG
ncbi:unnamed protein product, partial [Nesidiocoris tenuis]